MADCPSLKGRGNRGGTDLWLWWLVEQDCCEGVSLCAYHLTAFALYPPSTGNWRAGAPAPHAPHCPRMHGLKAGPCHQALPPHRENQVCVLWAVCQLRRTRRLIWVCEAQCSKPLACSTCGCSSPGPSACKFWLAIFALSGKEDPHWGSKNGTKMALLQWKYGLLFRRFRFKKSCEKTVNYHYWNLKTKNDGDSWTALLWLFSFCSFPL